MAVKVKVTEKEHLNELLGTILAWSVIASMIGKLLGFKFNLDSNDQMTQWGIQLGDAFKISRQKLKGSSIPADQRERIDRILSITDSKIRRLVQTEYDSLRRGNPADPNIDSKITALCDDAVNQIDSIIKDRKHAAEFVEPLRGTFNELKNNLRSAKIQAAMKALKRDPAFVAAVNASLGSSATPAMTNAVLLTIAKRIAKAAT